MAFGALLGAINGLLVTAAKVPALVITLGTLYVFRGLNNAWAGGKQYFAGDRPDAFGALSVDTVLGFPIITLLAILVVAAVAVYMAGTRPGRDLYAIGSDPDAATAFGIKVSKRVFLAFLANGALAGLAGVLYASRFNSVGATTGTGMELTVVAAAVVGGVAIFGGSGTVTGAALGAAAPDHHHQLPDRPAGRQVLATGHRRRADPHGHHHRPRGKPAHSPETADKRGAQCLKPRRQPARHRPRWLTAPSRWPPNPRAGPAPHGSWPAGTPSRSTPWWRS